MIKYALRCDHAHNWDAWFPSISGYDDQAARGLVACPYCDSKKVEKSPMAPSVVSSKSRATPPFEAAPATTETPVPVVKDDGPMSLSLPEPVKAMIAEIKSHIEKTHDYVGDTFAREVRAMHEGEIDHRPVYGEATPSEVKALIEDDIAVAPLPAALSPKGAKGLN
jgi:hypothetical protein